MPPVNGARIETSGKRPLALLQERGVRTVAVGYLLLMVVVPLLAVSLDGFREGIGAFWESLSSPMARHALFLTLWTALVMTLINVVMGTLTAYVLVRYNFPGKSLVNALIDIPFAIPTLVTGVMLATLFGPQHAVGAWLNEHLGWQIVFSPSGIILALMFVCLPLVVRAIQPVLMSIDRDQEEAAQSLGASGWAIFWRVLFPTMLPGILAGGLLSFSRALGEFGAIVLVAGNIPFRSQTAAVYVLGEIESENSLGASSMSMVLIAMSFFLVFLVGWWQDRREKRPF